jgi:hypothetical protein
MNDGDDPHTSPFEILSEKILSEILSEILSYDPRVARASVEIGAHRRARVNGIPSSATATSSVEESKKIEGEYRRRERTHDDRNGRRAKRRRHLWLKREPEERGAFSD